MLPTKFQVNRPFILGEEAKKYFQDGGHGRHLSLRIRSILAIIAFQNLQDGNHGCHLGFLIGTILALFDLQVTLMLPTKFQINWPFVSGEEKKIVLRWQPWRTSWISDQKDFSLCCSTRHLEASNQISSQFTFWFKRRCEKKNSR